MINRNVATVALLFLWSSAHAGHLPAPLDGPGSWEISECRKTQLPDQAQYFGHAVIKDAVLSYGETSDMNPSRTWHVRPANGEFRVRLEPLGGGAPVYDGSVFTEGELHVGVNSYQRPISGVVGRAKFGDQVTPDSPDQTFGSMSVNFNGDGVPEGFYEISFRYRPDNRSYQASCFFKRIAGEASPTEQIRYELPSLRKIPISDNGDYFELTNFYISIDLEKRDENNVPTVALLTAKYGFPYSCSGFTKNSIRKTSLGADEKGAYLEIEIGRAPMQRIHVYLDSKEIYGFVSAAYRRELIGIGN